MSAIISPCGQYRYRLDRRIDMHSRRVIAWIMVNPSTADAVVDDQTIKKVIGFSAANGFGHAIVGNLFAYRSTDVAALATATDPVGPDNDAHLRYILADADTLVFAWGAGNKLPASLRNRWRAMANMAKEVKFSPYCLGTCNDGHPRHPQMLGYSTPLELWFPPA